MTSDLARKYDRPVPRYTSYPPATAFGPQVDATAYAGWLGALGGTDTLSLYLHVPFCRAMCWFCGCHTRVAKSYAPVAAYVEMLIAEIDLVAGRLSAAPPVTFVHWGGGSPSLLAPADFRRLMDHLRARFRFAGDAEIAVELDPRTADPALIDTMARSGVTRASLGVQDFDAQVQEAIHRIQPYDRVAAVVDDLRAAGIAGINFDLIYGLPHQTEAGVARTAALAAGLEPDRVALFGYAHVPWMKPHQRRIDEAALPDASARFEQAEAAAEVLETVGYRRIGLDHFARRKDPLARAAAAGAVHRNFQGYTEDPASALIGFGASAIGQLPQGYVQNAVAIPDWRAAVAAGHLPVVRGYALTAEDRLRGEIIERLMCDLEVDIAAVAARHGAAGRSFGAERARLAPLAADGLVELQDMRVRITDAGRPFMRLAAAAFDAHFAPAPQRHARAV